LSVVVNPGKGSSLICSLMNLKLGHHYGSKQLQTGKRNYKCYGLKHEVVIHMFSLD